VIGEPEAREIVARLIPLIRQFLAAAA